MNKKQIIMLTVSILLNIFGITSILYLNGISIIPWRFYDAITDVNLLFSYIFVLVSMGGGIGLFTAFAASFEDKKRRDGLSIGIAVYATVLTLPLVYTFIGAFFVAALDIPLFMADDVADAAIKLLTHGGLYYTFFALGTVIAIVALIFPILTAYTTVKEIEMKDFLKGLFKKKA
jgi:hypothetical protein